MKKPKTLAPAFERIISFCPSFNGVPRTCILLFYLDPANNLPDIEIQERAGSKVLLLNILSDALFCPFLSRSLTSASRKI
jgi:hypothetical protein